MKQHVNIHPATCLENRMKHFFFFLTLIFLPPSACKSVFSQSGEAFANSSVWGLVSFTGVPSFLPASAPPERFEALIGAFSVLIIEKGNEFIDFISGRGEKKQHASVSAARSPQRSQLQLLPQNSKPGEF